MLLALPPAPFKELTLLVNQFNLVAADDDVQRIFYLQKINAELNKTELDESLFHWIYDNSEQDWHKHLQHYKINPDAAFLLKNIQFARAVAEHCEAKRDKKLRYSNEYDLFQQRDALLAKESFTEIREQYSSICHTLIRFVKKTDHLSNLVKKQESVLEASSAKFAAIREQDEKNSTATRARYKTHELGQQINNFNFKFTMSGWERPFVFRVEDREDLDIEQQLYSFPVSRYFAEDYGFFMWGFVNKSQVIEYKPVFLCEYAEQGNLTTVAKSLRDTNPKHIAAITTHYFNQLSNLCLELIKAKFYHPDIKLTNFLIHGNRILISDRKTLINTENCKVNTIRSTPNYAPQQYLECITRFGTFNVKGFLNEVNLPQFMAYQLGMALKEFLILTQQDEVSFEELRDPSCRAADYFTNPERALVNFSALINELTREDPKKRMSIKQMQELMNFRNHPTALFYKEIEKHLPIASLGVQEELDEINEFLQSPLKGLDLVNKANSIFNRLNNNPSPEPRLFYLIEQVASKCFKEGSYSYFATISQQIEHSLLAKDWQQAPWYRKLVHTLSFGYFRVAHKTQVDSITLDLDFKSEEFNTHLAQLEHLSHSEFNAFGSSEALNFTSFIFGNLEKIKQEEEAAKQQAEEAERQAQIAAKKANKAPTPVKNISEEEDDASFDNGTVVFAKKNPPEPINKEASIDDSNNGTVIFAKKKTEESKDEAELDNGTVVIKKNAADGKAEELKESEDPTPQKADAEAKLSANKSSFFTKANRRFTFKTYRTTMFRGDGTLTLNKEEKPRPTAKEVLAPIYEPESFTPR